MKNERYDVKEPLRRRTVLKYILLFIQPLIQPTFAKCPSGTVLETSGPHIKTKLLPLNIPLFRRKQYLLIVFFFRLFIPLFCILGTAFEAFN